MINNTINKSTGQSPSQIIFGLDQRGLCIDHVKDFLKTKEIDGNRDF